jgi:hypothetical protein
MSDQADYRARQEQWEDVELRAGAEYTTDTCLLELRARVEALEGRVGEQLFSLLNTRARVEALEAKYETMRLATLEWGADVDKVKRWSDQHLQRIMALEAAAGIRSGPESSLVELVADAIAAQATAAGIVNDRPARTAIAVIAGQLRAQCFVQAADWLEQEAKR